jgi:hypothetical protein
MERSEVVLERIKETWPADLPLPRVLFGVPVQPHDWAFTLDAEVHAGQSRLERNAPSHIGKNRIGTRLTLRVHVACPDTSKMRSLQPQPEGGISATTQALSQSRSPLTSCTL